MSENTMQESATQTTGAYVPRIGDLVRVHDNAHIGGQAFVADVQDDGKVWLKAFGPNLNGNAPDYPIWTTFDKVTFVHRDERVDRLNVEREQFRRRTVDLARQNAALIDEHETFKSQVAQVASRYGREHNMCSVLDEALGELGLERLESVYTIEVEVTTTVTVEVRNADSESTAESWVRNNLEVGSDGWESSDSDVTITDESGHYNVVVTSTSHDLVNPED